MPLKEQMKVKTKSKKVNKAWLNDHVNDPYVKLAQKEGYRARAAYKLKEIDETLRLIKPGQLVVDLGSHARRLEPVRAPPAVARRGGGRGAQRHHHRAGPAAHGADRGGALHPGRLPRARGAGPAGGSCWQGRQADVVVSDMAPNLSGIASADAARMEHLVELAVDFCQHHLKPEGALVAKVFHGSGYNQLVKLFKDNFPGRQTHQAQGLARQFVRNLSGRHGSEKPATRLIAPEVSADGCREIAAVPYDNGCQGQYQSVAA